MQARTSEWVMSATPANEPFQALEGAGSIDHPVEKVDIEQLNVKNFQSKMGVTVTEHSPGSPLARPQEGEDDFHMRATRHFYGVALQILATREANKATTEEDSDDDDETVTSPRDSYAEVVHVRPLSRPPLHPNHATPLRLP